MHNRCENTAGRPAIYLQKRILDGSVICHENTLLLEIYERKLTESKAKLENMRLLV